MRTAFIILAVALVTASSTTAAVKLTITSKDIKNGTIQPVDLSGKTKRSMRGARGTRGPAGPPGLQGPQGLPGPQGIQAITRVAVSTPVPPLSFRILVASCPSGQRVISGGVFFVDEIWQSEPTSSGSGWTVTGFNTS